jgi:hypothetical protein
LGTFVRFVCFKLDDRLPAATAPIGFAGVPFSFFQCLVAERRHDFVRSAAGICHAPTKRFAKTTRLAADRQAGSSNCIAH